MKRCDPTSTLSILYITQNYIINQIIPSFMSSYTTFVEYYTLNNVIKNQRYLLDDFYNEKFRLVNSCNEIIKEITNLGFQFNQAEKFNEAIEMYKKAIHVINHTLTLPLNKTERSHLLVYKANMAISIMWVTLNKYKNESIPDKIFAMLENKFNIAENSILDKGVMEQAKYDVTLLQNIETAASFLEIIGKKIFNKKVDEMIEPYKLFAHQFNLFAKEQGYTEDTNKITTEVMEKYISLNLS